MGQIMTCLADAVTYDYGRLLQLLECLQCCVLKQHVLSTCLVDGKQKVNYD